MEVAIEARPVISARALNIIAFSFLTAAGARLCVYLPFTPVPLTFQTFFVVLSGALLGRRDGAVSQLLYVCSGIAGLPVFSGGALGPAALFGPTGGYLVGFIAASAFTGAQAHVKESGNTGFIRCWILSFSAILIIYLFGAINLYLSYGYTPAELMTKGIIPFIPGDILKSALAAGISIKLIPAFRAADD